LPTNEFWKIFGEGDWGTLLSLQYEKRVHGNILSIFITFCSLQIHGIFSKKENILAEI